MITFNSYLTEDLGLLPEEVVDPSVIPEINDILYTELEKTFLTVQAGIEVIRNILMSYGIEVSEQFDMDPDGEELVIDISTDLVLYTIYSLNDEGFYEFFAELTDEEGLKNYLSSDEEEYEEDQE